MKKTLLMLIIFLYSAYTIAQQNNYLKVPDFFDKATINHIIDSLARKEAIKEYLIYQKNVGKDSLISYLFCKQSTSGMTCSIYKERILSSERIDSVHFFSYKHAAKTGAEKEEDQLKFKPPILCGVDNEVVIYCNPANRKTFYFEYGKNITTYEPFAGKEKYREEWLELIRKSCIKGYY